LNYERNNLSSDLTLNVFGDSYSTPNQCVLPSKSFWGLAAKDIGASNIINYSHSGFSLDAVLHILTNEVFNFADDYFLIGIPPLHRYIAYSDSKGQKWSAVQFDRNCNQLSEIAISSLDNTIPFTFEEQFNNNKKGVDRFNREWLDAQSLEKIFLLHQYLTQKKSKFLILNLSVQIAYQDQWPAGQSIMRKIKNLAECVMFDDTYQSLNYNDKIKPADFDQYGWLGHHGAVGNQNWYTKIVKNKMIELNWINNA
jgi:hypothetical protein